MTYLTDLRDHAQRLATGDHRDDCERIHRITKVDHWLADHGLDQTLSCASTDGHEPHEWIASSGLGWDCPGLCGGCMPDTQRRLWQQIANEIDAYLEPEDDGPDLFGGEG